MDTPEYQDLRYDVDEHIANDHVFTTGQVERVPCPDNARADRRIGIASMRTTRRAVVVTGEGRRLCRGRHHGRRGSVRARARD